MVLLDLNQVILANLFQQLKQGDQTPDEGLLRHMILNSIRAYLKKFKADYGELVIACDDYKYWRRDVFPYYKANRKKSRDESTLDWDLIFKSLNKIRDELKEYFPYRIIQVPGAEADDIIASLVFEYGWNMGQRILILSGDKDFIQLHEYPAVDQFSPIKKKWIKHTSPSTYLKEHIFKGDAGDGVPNVLSSDDCLVAKKRQATITAQRLDAWMKDDTSADCITRAISKDMLERNAARNRQLIDMSEIPKHIQDAVVKSYEAQANKPKKDLFGYFIKNKLKNLMDAIGDF